MHLYFKIEQNIEFQNFHRSVVLSRKDCLMAIKTFHFDKKSKYSSLFYMLIEFKLQFPKENSEWSNSSKTLRAHQKISFEWNATEMEIFPQKVIILGGS